MKQQTIGTIKRRKRIGQLRDDHLFKTYLIKPIHYSLTTGNEFYVFGFLNKFIF